MNANKQEQSSAVQAMKNKPASVRGAAKEPLFHISKRPAIPMLKAILIRAIAILIAMVFCGVITIVLTKKNPVDVYVTIFEGAFSGGRIWLTVHKMMILLAVSLAVTPAFKMKFWNIGAEGQVLAGALVTALLMVLLGGTIPEWLLIIILVVGSVAAGLLWGLIPAFFKAMWGTNETLFTLMMNYVIIQFIEHFLKVADHSGSNTVGPEILKYGHLPVIAGQRYLLTLIVVLSLTVFMYIYLRFTKHGYELSVVGESENTARYIGTNVKHVIMRTMMLSGAICGLTGLLLVSGTNYSIDANTAGGTGFTAIVVSWLAKFNPFMMVLTSLLVVFLGRGAEAVSEEMGVNKSFSDILTAIILFFIIGCEFFIQYEIKPNYNHRFFAGKKKEAA